MSTLLIWEIVILAISLVAAFAFMPHPKQPPASTQDLEVPTAQDGREVIDIAGTVWIDDPNIVWYGDLSTTPIHADSGK